MQAIEHVFTHLPGKCSAPCASVVSQKSVYKKGKGPIFRVKFNLKNLSYEQYEPFLF